MLRPCCAGPSRSYGIAPDVGGEVRVPKRHVHRCVAEQLLHGLERNAAHDEVRGEGVAEHVPAEWHGLSGPLGHGVQRVRAAVPVPALPVEGGEDVRPAVGMPPERGKGVVGERHLARTPALRRRFHVLPHRATDQQPAGGEVHVLPAQREQLADAKAGPERQHRAGDLPRGLDPARAGTVETGPLAEGDYYPGDLLKNVLQVDASFWRAHPAESLSARGVAQRALSAFDERARAAEGDVPGGETVDAGEVIEVARCFLEA